MVGQKFSEGKLPLFKVLFEQFPDSVQEVVRASKGGHEKYKLTDKNWDNWKKVENGQEKYRDAAMRHLLLSVKEVFDPTMEEFEPGVRHAAQAIWNIMAFLQLDIEKEEQDRLVGINQSRLQASVRQGQGVDIKSWAENVEKLIENSKEVRKTNLDEWMAKHKVENELKDIDLSFRPEPQQNSIDLRIIMEDTPETQKWIEEIQRQCGEWNKQSRPRLSVDELVNQEKDEDYYPDQGIN